MSGLVFTTLLQVVRMVELLGLLGCVDYIRGQEDWKVVGCGVVPDGLFVIKNQENNESDRRNNCHPSHELEHKVFLLLTFPKYANLISTESFTEMSADVLFNAVED